MALLTRARGMALAGATAFAVAVPVSPLMAAPAASAVPAVGISTATVAAVNTAGNSPKRQKIIRKARALKGVPYVYGGSTPRGFDCSGFTSYVHRKSGVSIPRTATTQMYKAKRISRAKAKRGDLVFFRSGSRAYHVGIYAGKNRVLHSPRPGQRVHTAKIWTSNVTFGRVT